MMLEAVRAPSTVRNSVDEQTLGSWVGRYGGSVSTALLAPDAEHFFVDGLEGAIAYRLAAGCAVAIGDPICALRDRAVFASCFRAHCESRRLRTVYAVASESFAAWAASGGLGAIEFGEEWIMDPAHDPIAGGEGRKLRGKVNRAVRAGVVVEEYVRAMGRDPALECAMQGVVEDWLDGRHGPQIYLEPLGLFVAPECKRWFYAREQDRITGVLLLVRLEAHDGYLFSQLIAEPGATPGTTELLAVTALHALGAEGVRFATWGAAPLPDLGRTAGLGPLAERVLRATYRTASRAFHLEARNVYRRKFPIASTSGAYLLFDPPHVGWRESIAVMRAFHASPR